jgi:hypothetical protein
VAQQFKKKNPPGNRVCQTRVIVLYTCTLYHFYFFTVPPPSRLSLTPHASASLTPLPHASRLRLPHASPSRLTPPPPSRLSLTPHTSASLTPPPPSASPHLTSRLPQPPHASPPGISNLQHYSLTPFSTTLHLVRIASLSKVTTLSLSLSSVSPLSFLLKITALFTDLGFLILAF